MNVLKKAIFIAAIAGLWSFSYYLEDEGNRLCTFHLNSYPMEKIEEEKLKTTYNMLFPKKLEKRLTRCSPFNENSSDYANIFVKR